MTASPLYETTALSNTSVPIRRQFRNVRRTRNGVPDVFPSSVTSMVNVSVRFGTGSPRSKIWAMTSSRTSRSAPGITGCPGATSSRMNCRRSRRLAGWLPQLRNRIELANGGLLIHPPEDGRDLDQQRPGGTAAEDGHVWRVPQFGGVDRLASRPADVLLRDEVRGSERHRRDPGRRSETACRPAPAIGRCRAGSSRSARVASDHERRPPASQVAGVGCVFGDLPAPDEADARWMKKTREALAIRPPAQVGCQSRATARTREEIVVAGHAKAGHRRWS